MRILHLREYHQKEPLFSTLICLGKSIAFLRPSLFRNSRRPYFVCQHFSQIFLSWRVRLAGSSFVNSIGVNRDHSNL